jgi:hypothetical protein
LVESGRMIYMQRKFELGRNRKEGTFIYCQNSYCSVQCSVSASKTALNSAGGHDAIRINVLHHFVRSSRQILTLWSPYISGTTHHVTTETAKEGWKIYLAKFPKLGLYNLHPSVCVSLPNNFWLTETIFMKLGMYVMAATPISTAYYINPFHESVCLWVSLLLLAVTSVNSILPFGARQLLG